MKRLALLVVLLSAALLFSFKIYGVWVGDQVKKSPAPPRTAAVSPEKQLLRPTPEPPATYEPIVERNLFNAERKEKVTVAPVLAAREGGATAPEVKEVRIAGREIILYGTMSRGNYKSALISNPLKSPEDKRDNRWVKIGDQLANLQVDAIQSDKIILREGENRYIILLRDPTKPKAAVAAKATPPAANRNSPTVIPTDVGSEARAVDKPVGDSVQTGASDKPEGDEYVIVKGPFGDKRVRKTKP